ncbi:MAG: neutral zinc metallopeptidase [Beijerinckiaceae bacterium]
MCRNICSKIQMLRRPSLVAISRVVETAQAIGDDVLQRLAHVFSVPDFFIHGTAAQRVRWFNAGLKLGEDDSCNIFAR